MTLQEIFDKVATHLLDQGCKSQREVYGETLCAYRAGNLRCAIGCLIDDAYYHDDMGSLDVRNLHFKFPTVLPALGINANDEKTLNFLDELQEVHDHFSPESWAETLVEVADRYNLNNSVLNGRG